MKYKYDVNIIREYSLSNFYVSLSQMINIIINNNKGASIISTNFMIYKNNDNIIYLGFIVYKYRIPLRQRIKSLFKNKEGKNNGNWWFYGINYCYI